MKGNRKREQYL